MTISAGTRLGPYEVVAPIGAGGMGEVYRARDTRLDRIVAVKILPAEFANNAQLKVRFEREARTISQLSHPNICTLYDVGENYLVMELLDGETLADRLSRGALPLADVLKYGSQIADALGKAHRHGVVHRDLKPGNIMITKSGAKLLDFGLAKNVATAVSPSEATLQQPLTQEGVVLGTFQYMAPEQLTGEEPDARTDIFALGAVLYEMATGKRAFEGKTKTSVVAAIVSGEPRPIAELQPLTPPALEHVIVKCLTKERDDRWQSAADIAEELRWIAQATPQPQKLGGRPWVYAAIPALMIAAAIGGYLAARKRPQSMVLTEIDAPEKATFDFESGAPVLSPDGEMVAFIARPAEGQPMIWVRRLDSDSPQPLRGTEDAVFPFWSPDSRSIAFFSRGKVKRIAAGGGAPETLANASTPRGGAWSKDGTIIFAPSPPSALFRVSAAGGDVQPVSSLDVAHGETSHRFPAFLPDGRHFLAFVQGLPETNNILLGSIDSKERRLILRADSGVVFAPPDLVLFLRNGTLRAQRMDMKRFEMIGESVPIAEGVQASSTLSYGAISASNRGSIAYAHGAGSTLSTMKFFDAHGTELGTVGQPSDQLDPRLAPDGHAVAASRFDSGGTGHIWFYDLRRNIETLVTTTSSWTPVWSPDSKAIVYTSFAGSPGDLFIRRVDGTTSELLLADKRRKLASDWSADGRYLIYHVLAPERYWDIEAYSFADKKVFPVVQGAAAENNGHVSPDGKWLAYVSDSSGIQEVYVQQFPTATQKFQISGGGGTMPAWSPDGRELYFWQGNKLMAATVHHEQGFVADAPHPLFEARVRTFVGVSRNQYEVTRDKRFLINVNVNAQTNPSITLVQNWTARLTPPSTAQD